MCELLAVATPQPIPFTDVLPWAAEVERLGVGGFGWGVAWTGIDGVRRYRKKGVAIEVSLGDVPLRLMADPIQLQEAVVNLVRNAIDATVRGSVGVRLEERPALEIAG